MSEIQMISITKAEHDRLLVAEAKLGCLESAGVDNWEGYDNAIKAFHEISWVQ